MTIEERRFTLILFSAILGAILFFYYVISNHQEQSAPNSHFEGDEAIITYTGPRLGLDGKVHIYPNFTPGISF